MSGRSVTAPRALSCERHFRYAAFPLSCISGPLFPDFKRGVCTRVDGSLICHRQPFHSRLGAVMTVCVCVLMFVCVRVCVRARVRVCVQYGTAQSISPSRLQ